MVGPRVGGGDVGSGGEFRVAGSWGGGAQVMVVVNGGDLKMVGSMGLVWCLGSVDVCRKMRATE